MEYRGGTRYYNRYKLLSDGSILQRWTQGYLCSWTLSTKEKQKKEELWDIEVM
jgi:hypothetical protein